MTPDHAAWRERVLAYEDLESRERAETDVHLRSCASCRELLHGLQVRESAARAAGQLPLEAAALTSEEATAERASAERLLQRLAATAGAVATGRAASGDATLARPRPIRVRVPIWAWGVPAAAAAVLAIVFWSGPRGERGATPSLGSVAVEHASTMRGANDPGFRTGDAFSVRFELKAAARPIVVALDEAGTAEVLYPAGDSEARLFPPGIAVLPDSSAGERWIFSGPPGRETFLAGSLRGPSADIPALRAELERATAAAPDRAGRVRAARAVLAKQADSVTEISVAHAAPAPR